MSGILPTIYEDEAENDPETLITQDFYDEMMSNNELCEDPSFNEDTVIHNIQHMPANTVAFTCQTTEDCAFNMPQQCDDEFFSHSTTITTMKSQ